MSSSSHPRSGGRATGVRGVRARVAEETLRISKGATYKAPSGKEVDISESVKRAIDQTVVITPEEAEKLVAESVDELQKSRAGAPVTRFDVVNADSFDEAKRLTELYGEGNVSVLNFASARNAGGGFLRGAQAQEESLARSSALYITQETKGGVYYSVNRRPSNSLLYTDHMIYSMGVPVFRDSTSNALLETPWHVNVITSPAPNRGAVAQNKPADLPLVEPTMRRRMQQVLAAAVARKQKAIILGAWGCGVFGNAPQTVARLFAEYLLDGGAFEKAFVHVSFAVLARDEKFIEPFNRLFQS
eukprot:m.50382 g.50382  ORF g.50382 m.50382 type:complete len:302 (-) comp12899_c0_seq1:119-1024(-)